jgi:hypothetical protein
MREGRTYQGITGPIAFQLTGDVTGKPMAMTRVRRGALVVQRGGGE